MTKAISMSHLKMHFVLFVSCMLTWSLIKTRSCQETICSICAKNENSRRFMSELLGNERAAYARTCAKIKSHKNKFGLVKGMAFSIYDVVSCVATTSQRRWMYLFTREIKVQTASHAPIKIKPTKDFVKIFTPKITFWQ